MCMYEFCKCMYEFCKCMYEFCKCMYVFCKCIPLSCKRWVCRWTSAWAVRWWRRVTWCVWSWAACRRRPLPTAAWRMSHRWTAWPRSRSASPHLETSPSPASTGAAWTGWTRQTTPTTGGDIEETSRERPKSAPYPRLKNSKRTSKFPSIGKLGLLLWKKIFEKKSHSAEKMDPLVSSGIVCYAGNLFGSVPWANRYILASSENFVELLVELFWSVQVVLKKKHSRKAMTIVDFFLKKSAD